MITGLVAVSAASPTLLVANSHNQEAQHNIIDPNTPDEHAQDAPPDPQHDRDEQGSHVAPRSEVQPAGDDTPAQPATPGPPATGGLDAYLAASTDAALEADPSNEELSGPTDIPPSSPQRRKPPAALTLVLLAVLVFVILLSVLAGVKLNDDRKQIAAAMSETLRVLEAGGVAGATRPQLVALRNALDAGRYSEVKGLVADMLDKAATERPERPGLGDANLADGPVGGRLPPEAYAEFSDDEAAYFRQHEDLLVAFLKQCNIARELRDSGVDVDDLRAVRDGIKEAARLGQHDKVETLLANMTRMTRQKGAGAPPEIPEDLRPLIEQFHKAAQEAHRQGRNVQPALEMLKRAEILAEEGKMEQSKSVIRRAMAAARNATRMSRPARGGRRPGILRAPGERRAPRAPQGDGGIANILLQGLMGMISTEELDLTLAYQKIDNAMVAVREKNAEQIKEILDGALDHFSVIGKRRQEFSMMMNEIMARRRAAMQSPGVRGQGEVTRGPARGDRPAAGQGRPEGFRPMPAEREEAMRQAMANEIVDVLERAHGLTGEQFEKRKQAIADQVMELLRPRARPGGAADPSQLDGITLDGEREKAPPVPGYESEQEQAAAEQRIRDKLQSAQQPLNELREATENEELVAELEELFSAVRDALYAGNYMEAEKLTNEGLTKLGVTVENPGPVGETQPDEKTDTESEKPDQPTN